ncbi:glutaminase A [Acidaminobacter hydrogenoformans]|uniref:Glutaminase n=1 Tax=Acidaminobacter hydrogenoformans DSM 2784 TaxID=1120920 RepID=A0A1G5RT63_9FIRM|nr:glutaminase A [Acidaminobacter hydrogenoformans]SCZ77274.1 L-glutaminase [Acidaminobacter hydrogenoformans DSM 2784]
MFRNCAIAAAAKMHDYLNQLVEAYAPAARQGRVATYIPELAKVDPDGIGICVRTAEGLYCAGDAETKFTIQSVSKPMALILALMDWGPDKIFEKVGKEPTGDPFNSMIRLETHEKHKPFNPMINAGAISIAAMIKGDSTAHKIERLLGFVRKIAHNPNIEIDQRVYLSEKETGHRNRSIAHFLRAMKNFDQDPDEVLEVYFSQCSISLNCSDLSNMAMVLALDGKCYVTGEQLFPVEYAKIAKAYMVTCGMYDGSGEFAIHVGLPAKSGVGGGIMAVSPGQMGIGVYGPALDPKGNSVVGIKMLKALSDTYNLNIF